MVFTENTFQNCISKLNDINAILFFQSNFGLATEMADKIKQNFEYDESVIIDFQDNEKKFTAILQEYLCDGFFASRKIIKVFNFKPNGKSKLKDELQFLNDRRFDGKIVLFFAPDLDGKSSFKTFFEKGLFTASIACYEDDRETAIRSITNFFTKKEKKISPQAVDAMAEMLHGDRKMLISECEKMMFYSNNEEITISDIYEAIIDEQEANPGFFIDFFLSGDLRKAMKEWRSLEREDIQMILLMRLFVRSVEEIIDIKNNAKSIGIDDAIKSKFIFWKRVGVIKNAVKRLTDIMLGNYIKIALQTEKLAKIYGNDIAKCYFVRNAILFGLK